MCGGREVCRERNCGSNTLLYVQQPNQPTKRTNCMCAVVYVPIMDNIFVRLRIQRIEKLRMNIKQENGL